MNWILRYSNKFDYHTNLKAVLAPIIEDIGGLKWLISDLEYTSLENDALPINMVDDYLVLSPEQFRETARADMQVIWGVLLGIPQDDVIDMTLIRYHMQMEMHWYGRMETYSTHKPSSR